MDPVAQDVMTRLGEVEASLAAMNRTFPITYAALSAVLMAVVLFIREVLTRYAGLPAQAVEAVASAVMGRVEKTADAFFTTKAANFARKSDLDIIVNEVRATRQATAQIEEYFSRRKFVSERTYDFAAKAVERMIEPLFTCLESRERLLASARAERVEQDNDGPPFTLPKLDADERTALRKLCDEKQAEFRRACAMAPVVLTAEIVAILAKYDKALARLNSQPWEQWEDDEKGHIEQFVRLERATYNALCGAARKILIEQCGFGEPSDLESSHGGTPEQRGPSHG